MRYVTDKQSEEEYRLFLETNERCNFQQSIEWSKVKIDWKAEIVLAEDSSGKIIGSLMILIKKIPVFGNIMYSPRGPICDIHNMEVLKQLTEGVKELAKKYNAIIYRAEPDIINSDENFRSIMIDLGYQIKDNTKNLKEEIQPSHVFMLDIKDKTEEEIFKKFHSKTRYNIRLAMKKGIVVKECTKSDLKEFNQMMMITGTRKGFITKPLSYFEKIYDCLGKKHIKLLMAYYEDKPIAGAIVVMYGNKTWYLYGASSDEHKNLMPNYLLQWEMIRLAINNKSDVYDLRGVPRTLENSGLYRFNKGFNSEYTEFIGEVCIEFKPIKCKLYNFAKKIFKKLRI